MELILNINKPIGITSYDVIRILKKRYPGEKIGHAGTLDPLATGVLICLVGKDATKRQSEFMNISKEYEFDVLFGFETDTYDILGFPKITAKENDVDTIHEKVENLLTGFKGMVKQQVPPFSAVKINGKPLYRWYLDGEINKIVVPTREITIDDIKIINSEILDIKNLESVIFDTLSKTRKGFRKEDVMERWENLLSKNRDNRYIILTIKTKVSKGTYVRAIAHDIGKQLGVGACITKLVRTKVGEYMLEDSIEIESPSL